MKEEALEKPTDNELREQIKGDWKGRDIVWSMGIVVGVILIIFGQVMHGLILGMILFILANQNILAQKLDKVRLEIRER